MCGIADFGTSIAAQIIDGGWVARPIPSSPKPHATDGMDKPPLPAAAVVRRKSEPPTKRRRRTVPSLGCLVRHSASPVSTAQDTQYYVHIQNTHERVWHSVPNIQNIHKTGGDDHRLCSQRDCVAAGHQAALGKAARAGCPHWPNSAAHPSIVIVRFFHVLLDEGGSRSSLALSALAAHGSLSSCH